jgi:hypothetical protein
MRVVAWTGWMLVVGATLAVAADDAIAAKDRAIRAKLDKPITLNFKDAPLGSILKFVRAATKGPNDKGVPIYVDPEALNKAGVNIDTLLTITSRQEEPLKTSLARGLSSLRLRFKVEDGLLKIVEAQIVEDVALPPGTRVDVIDRSAKGQAIENQLARRLKLVDVALEDALETVKTATKGEALPNGLPIYVDPVGLQEAERTMISEVTLVTAGKPLKDALRAALEPLGLTYVAKDGLVTITSLESEDVPIVPLTEEKGAGSKQ